MVVRVTSLFGALYITSCLSKFVLDLANISTMKGAEDPWLNKAATFIRKHRTIAVSVYINRQILRKTRQRK